MSGKRSLSWTHVLPVLACALLVVVWGRPMGTPLVLLAAAGVVTAVVLGVHHAEIVAHRVGEPFGTLVLALAITVIELGLIGSIMLSGGKGASTLARDTLFATVMIVCNGVVGGCLVVGALRHHILAFRAEGASHALAVLVPLVTLTLVLPLFTTTTPGPTYSLAQLAFAGAASLTLYVVYVFAQTVRHRDYFLPVGTGADEEHAAPPSTRVALTSMGLLLLCLVAVVGLAKQLAPVIASGVRAVSAPPTTVGVVIALIILLPESVAAIRAAARNRMQTSLNLALGSALATIGLTIPCVAMLAGLLDLPLVLGLAPAQIVLLTLTMLLSAITLAGGRATILHGAVHLVVFGAFLVLALVP
jgi:Ca2+:H+ antiporter